MLEKRTKTVIFALEKRTETSSFILEKRTNVCLNERLTAI